MKVLVAFEESQEICKAFRELGHEAYSCDLQECSGGHPEWHLQMDARTAIAGCLHRYDRWDIIIMHPPCTAVAVSGNGTYAYSPERKQSARFIKQIWELAKAKAYKVCLENPVGVLNSLYPNDFPRPQYIQPWQFGHGETKKTGLWLYGLERLAPTKVVDGREQKVWKMTPSPQRSKLRAKTYPGIAKAMAEQWG